MSRKTFIAAQRIRAFTGQHVNWDTKSDGRTLRFNSRSYVQASGDSIGFQCKPSQTVTTTGEVRGGEFSPRLQSGIGSQTLVGFMSDPTLKGSAGGNITARFVAAQLQLTDANAGTRTIAVAAMIDAWHQLAGTHTMTTGVGLINARTAGSRAWDYFLRAVASGDGGLVVGADGMTANPQDDAEDGHLKVRVGLTDYQIPIYAA